MESSSKARSYRQCFICREWGWDVSRPTARYVGVDLCLPCYVDILEVKQGRGLMVTEDSTRLGGDDRGAGAESGKSPSPYQQVDMFLCGPLDPDA